MGGWFSRERWRSDVTFVSLGMVVLDELRFPGKAPLLDVMGGSGAYATLGARLFASGQSSTIGCLVMAGKDFPEEVENNLRKWKTTLILKRDLNRLSTRGLLEYEDSTFGPKKFKYTTVPLRPSPSDLLSSPLLRSQAYHFLSKQEEIINQVIELLELRKRHGVSQKPLIVWEPFPASCQPENLESTLDAYKAPVDFKPEVLESYAQKFLDHSIGPDGQGCVVIRAAEHGSLSASRAAGFIWSPAFYAPSSGSSRVVDPTGAGNAFMGGFATALQQNLSLDEASAYGNVAASFALEQIGAPKLEYDGPTETWNGVKVKERLEEYRTGLRNIVS